jgi:hypothetical protein
MLPRNEPYQELGVNYFDEDRREHLVDQLTGRIEHLGYRVCRVIIAMRRPFADLTRHTFSIP